MEECTLLWASGEKTSFCLMCCFLYRVICDRDYKYDYAIILSSGGVCVRLLVSREKLTLLTFMPLWSH